MYIFICILVFLYFGRLFFSIKETLKECNTTITTPIYSIPNSDALLTELTLPDKSLYFYKHTEFRPDCCSNTCGIKTNNNFKYNDMKTTGCPCINENQIRFINKRGGNNTTCNDRIIF